MPLLEDVLKDLNLLCKKAGTAFASQDVLQLVSAPAEVVWDSSVSAVLKEQALMNSSSP